MIQKDLLTESLGQSNVMSEVDQLQKSTLQLSGTAVEFLDRLCGDTASIDVDVAIQREFYEEVPSSGKILSLDDFFLL